MTNKCLVCNSASVVLFLDLGETTLANKFLAKEELGRPEPAYPLRVGHCSGCGHVQLMETVPPQAMFDHYLYVSSMSDTLKGHLHTLSDRVVSRMRLGAGDLVVDVGSNDGTLLSGFLRHSVNVLGVDPAANLAAMARSVGVETMTAYFGAETAREIVARHGKAAVVTATNVFPHLPLLQDFIAGLDAVLGPKGTFVLEAHYLQDLLDAGAFDTVYHEHCSYWSLGPMVRLFRDAGFEVVDVERLPIHHGQLRAWVRRKGIEAVSDNVHKLLEQEKRRGFPGIGPFNAFADATVNLKRELNREIDSLRAAGKRVVGYGAPAKGNTLLTFLGIGPDRIEYIADKSPLKQGRFTPGMHIPVVGPERLLTDQPDYVLLLAWNFAEEIMAQQTDYRKRGGRFIVPVPHVAIV
jgi:predicted TPR repeat methyltransferase